MWWCFVDTFWRSVRLNNKPTDCKTPNVRLHMFVSFREDLPTDDQQQNIAIIFLHRNNRQHHVHVLYYRIRFNMWLSHQQISREIYTPCTYLQNYQMKTRRSARIKACSRDVIKAYLSLRAICLCKKEEHITLARHKTHQKHEYWSFKRKDF